MRNTMTISIPLAVRDASRNWDSTICPWRLEEALEELTSPLSLVQAVKPSPTSSKTSQHDVLEPIPQILELGDCSGLVSSLFSVRPKWLLFSVQDTQALHAAVERAIAVSEWTAVGMGDMMYKHHVRKYGTEGRGVGTIGLLQGCIRADLHL
ncbi:hypothetical protein E3N88_23270 [Mikania micrantha]|uniref:Uncharacterized protein n=1 Tax=Mikania micrantha TaxID=192012 RepID=A0A5N6NDZ5_9ASTR|nr:hypothetical protein E3N88_23270 [Mikania micrantha]